MRIEAARGRPRSGSARPPAAKVPFRPDVEGLRAVAIVAVVLYHAHLGVLSGGYVGVDVFFVLSGFLITRLLWTELGDTGRISFMNFYARRVRRLLPASALVIVATVGLAAILVSPLQARSVTTDAISAALYVGNYRFAVQGTNYLNSSAAPSPLQHYWSLGVEEQFYLIWPLLLVAASRLFRTAARSRRAGSDPSGRGALAVLSGVAVVSFAGSVWLTQVSQPWAFFSLPTRAWELATGGLMAFGVGSFRRLPAPLAAALGWTGAAGIGWAALTFTAHTPFPGAAAVVPVLGTAAILITGSGPAPAGPVTLLRRRPFQVLGKLSYTWYLWHWPVLVLAPYALGRPLGLFTTLLAIGVSLLLAALTAVLVERPLRIWPLLAGSATRSVAMGAALSTLTAGSALLVATNLGAVRGQGLAPVAQPPPQVAVRPRPTVTAQGSAGLMQAAAAAVQAANRPVAAAVAASVRVQPVPANLTPPLSQAQASQALPFRDGCFDSFTDTAVHACRYGTLAASKTVVAFGDSHAAMWFPALAAIAQAQKWRLEVFSKATCPPVNAPLFSAELGHPYYECAQWRAAVLARLRVEHPAVVVLATTRNYGGPYQLTSYSQPWLQGLASMVRSIRQFGAEVVVIGPIPQPAGSVPYCLSAHLANELACALPAATSINSTGVAAEKATVIGSGGRYLNTQSWFCAAGTCPVVIDNLLVYRDMSHLTVPFARYLTGPLAASLFKDTRGAF